MRYPGLLIGLFCFALTGPAAAQPCGDADPRFCAIPDPSLLPPGANPKRLKYGNRYWQEIAFYSARTDSSAPLIAVLETGGKTGSSGWLRYRLNEAGYSVAFIRYGEAVSTADGADAAYTSALAYLFANAAELNIDAQRIALFASGGTARTAALLGTDPSLLEAAGVPFASLRAVVGVDGRDFDVRRRIAEAPHLAGRLRRYYGRDPADYLRLSPTTHVASPNAPAFLMIVDEKAIVSAADSKELVESFARSGIDARLLQLPPHRPAARRTHFMLEPDGSGSEILPFLLEQFSSSQR